MLLFGRWFADLTRFRIGLDGVPAGSGLAHHETSGGLGPSAISSSGYRRMTMTCNTRRLARGFGAVPSRRPAVGR